VDRCDRSASQGAARGVGLLGGSGRQLRLASAPGPCPTELGVKPRADALAPQRHKIVVLARLVGAAEVGRAGAQEAMIDALTETRGWLPFVRYLARAALLSRGHRGPTEPRRVTGDLMASLERTFEVGLQWERAIDYASFIFPDRIAYGISMRSRPLLFEDFLS
jgi:hypothetical protein